MQLAILGLNKYLSIAVERSIKIWLKEYLDQLRYISVSQHPLPQIQRNLPLLSRKEKVKLQLTRVTRRQQLKQNLNGP